MLNVIIGRHMGVSGWTRQQARGRRVWDESNERVVDSQAMALAVLQRVFEQYSWVVLVSMVG